MIGQLLGPPNQMRMAKCLSPFLSSPLNSLWLFYFQSQRPESKPGGETWRKLEPCWPCVLRRSRLLLKSPWPLERREMGVLRSAVYVGTRPLVITSMSWHVKDARAFSGRVTCQPSPTGCLWHTRSHITGPAISLLNTVSGPQLDLSPRFIVWASGPFKGFLMSLGKAIYISEKSFIFCLPTQERSPSIKMPLCFSMCSWIK